MKDPEWKDSIFDYPDHITTMISAEEKQYLYWLGCSVWKGEGLVVEIGPWLGGSTCCLATGMKDSGHETSKRLIVYDNFIWRKFMSERAKLDIKPGECFHHEFLKNVFQYESIIDSYKQALPDEVISGDQDAQSKRYIANEGTDYFQTLPGSLPVEILFVDGAKSWLGLKHLLLNISNRLVPGQSILVFQDFKYWGNYWVPVMLTLLGDHFQQVHNVFSATTVAFRLVRPISNGTLKMLESHIADVPCYDALNALDHAAQTLRLSGDVLGAANVLLGKVMLLNHQNKPDQAIIAFRESQTNWPWSAAPIQLERARKYLAESRLDYVPASFKLRTKQIALRIKQAARRMTMGILGS